jgi:PAS domain S-box-containing protein
MSKMKRSAAFPSAGSKIGFTMSRIEALFILPYIGSLFLSLGVIGYTWQRRYVRGVSAFIWYTIGQAIWIASYILELLESNLGGKLFWDGLQWIAGALIVFALPIFVTRFTDTKFRGQQTAILLSLAAPLILSGLVVTDAFHHRIYPDPRLAPGEPFDELVYSFTPIVYAFAAYSYIVVGASVSILFRQYARLQTLYRAQLAIIAIGICIPALGAMLTLSGLKLAPQRDISPIAFALGNLLIVWGLYHYRVFEVLPFGRDKVFEAMVEPVVILDNQRRIADINTSMLDLLGQSAANVIGKPAKEVFLDFPIPIRLYTHVSYARAETTFQVRGKNVYYEMTVWPLYDSNRNMTGRIYISHDITAFKELESELRDLNQRLEQRVDERTRELAEAYDTTLEGWAKALELRDKETEGHSRRVCDLTVRLARALDIPESEIVHIRRGAILHDIGKMAIPDHILLKKGKLSREDRLAIERHPEIAFAMLKPIQFLNNALDIPYCHHERWDGSGYPRGLKGRAIPLAARIFAVVDVWDALHSERPYKKAWSRERIVRYMAGQAGILFDPRIVDVFLQLAEKGEI